MRDDNMSPPNGPDAIGSLPPVPELPPDLEDNVVSRLRSRGLLQLSWQRRAVGIGLRTAAAVAIFVLGWTAALNRPAPAVDPRPLFMVLLHEAAQQPVSTDDLVRRVAEYRDWATIEQEAGFVVDGHRLDDEVRWLRAGQALSGPAEASLTGYFLVRAESLDEAAQVARRSPHVGYGGDIEIRPLIGGR